MCPPIAAAILAYSVMGRLFPTADTGLLAIACWLLNTTCNIRTSQHNKPQQKAISRTWIKRIILNRVNFMWFFKKGKVTGALECEQSLCCLKIRGEDRNEERNAVTLARSLDLRSSPRIFEQKRDYLQCTGTLAKAAVNKKRQGVPLFTLKGP